MELVEYFDQNPQVLIHGFLRLGIIDASDGGNGESSGSVSERTRTNNIKYLIIGLHVH